jgi:integrase
LWIKDPNKTAKDNRRIVPQPDTGKATDITINEVIEAYCGAETLNPLTNEMESERGFSKDYKQGYRTSKSCKTWFRYMAGYNKRQLLLTFEDDENGYGVPKFLSNKHLRTIAPRSMRDVFRKYPPGTGIIKDRVYYNRRQKQTYTIPASKNKSIYDSDIGKSPIAELTPGAIEAWIRHLSSMEVKKEYVKCFSTLWIYARKRGWLGTNPGDCPFYDGKVYVKKEPRGQDPYKDVSIDPKEFEIFWRASEELSQQFPFKAELHQFMLLTALRKQEALKIKKGNIDWDGMVINIPRGIEKNRYKDQVIIITPELEILLRNILDLGKRPGLSFYKMSDFPWLFATRKWSADKYFNKEFRHSPQARLGGDENYVPALRKRMKELLGNPDDFIYSSKVLRKTYITLSKQMNEGRSDRVRHLSRHKSEEILEQSYHKPSIPMVRDFANKTTEVLKFIRRRSA